MSRCKETLSTSRSRLCAEPMRIGCVPYGHAKPFALAWPTAEPLWGHPKELAEKLRTGELDLALVPVWEVLAHPGYRVIDGVAVGAKGEVRSVAVFHDKPLQECGTITLTEHSMTSVQLWRLVAARMKFKIQEGPRGEAQLLIGDEALQEWRKRKGKGVMDLGKAWWDWTSLPFVFAVWAVGPKSKARPTDWADFREACLAGVAKRGDWAKGEEEREYLTKCIQYGLGKEEKEGLNEFAQRSGLGKVDIEWV